MIDLLRTENWRKDHDLIDSLVARVYMFGTFDAQTGIPDELNMKEYIEETLELIESSIS